ncbi:hypothetical protein Aduo_006119 [Ancylostoma duodenale]
MISRGFLIILVLPTLLDAFEVHWNFPSGTCQVNHCINFDEYGIKTNKNVSFYGEKIVIFYEFIFGLYPYYKGYNETQPVKGGLPQNCSLEDHLNITKQNITERIPEEDYDGLAIIDLEGMAANFRPKFLGKKECLPRSSTKQRENFSFEKSAWVENYVQKRSRDSMVFPTVTTTLAKMVHTNAGRSIRTGTTI